MKYYTSFFLFTLFAVLTSSACSSIFALGTAALITSTWNDPRTIGTQLDDHVLEIHITQALNKNEKIKKFSRIKNTVYQGNILLTGQVPSAEVAAQVIKTVANICSSKNIYDAIRQMPPISVQDVLLDLWISNQIRLNLLIHKNIHFANVKVITENREVFLLGQITHQESRKIVKIAHSVNGVQNVFTAFSYI